MNLKIVYGFQHVPKVRAFDLWPLDLIKSDIHGLHSLSLKDDRISFIQKKNFKTSKLGDSSH